MSKHRSRSRDNNEQNNNFMGLNPQMLQMLGLSNADIQRISGLMNSMGSDGFDINSLGNLLNPNNNMNNDMNNNLNNQSNNFNNQNNLSDNQNNTNNNNMDFSYLLNMLNNMGNNSNYTNGMMNNSTNSFNNGNNFDNSNNYNNGNGFSDNNYNNYPKEEYEYEDDVDVEIIEPDLDGDPNISMLKAVKSLVNDDRKKFLKRVIEMYKNGEIVY